MFRTKVFASLSVAAFVSACSSPVPVNELPTASRPVAGEAATAQSTNTRDISPVQTGSVDALSDPQGTLAKRSIYFDYNSYLLRADGQHVVENHASYLNKNKSRKIIIQGNTDERGGTEYNLALGQKRAEAVRKSLALLGVSENQMEAVSLGENKPKATNGGESAWTENRRADIIY